MKKPFAAFIMLLLLCGCTPTPVAASGSIETKKGTVVDRAMDNNIPYVGILFEDGSGDCFYELKEDAIPDHIAVGDRVELTYGLDERTHYWFIIELQAIE